jgi:DNA-directed RNA polymerase subunit RPC12/RpoP
MSIGPGYACVPCQTYLRPRKNDIYVLETMSDPERPYKVWNADLWECPDCGHQVILGYGMHEVAEHFEPDFQDYLQMVTHTIKGCPKRLPGD